MNEVNTSKPEVINAFKRIKGKMKQEKTLHVITAIIVSTPPIYGHIHEYSNSFLNLIIIFIVLLTFKKFILDLEWIHEIQKSL